MVFRSQKDGEIGNEDPQQGEELPLDARPSSAPVTGLVSLTEREMKLIASMSKLWQNRLAGRPDPSTYNTLFILEKKMRGRRKALLEEQEGAA